MDTACTPVFTTPMPMAPTTDPMLDTTILARDLPKPSPRLTLRLTPLFSTAPMDTITPVCTPVFTTPMPMVPTTDPMVDTTILARDLPKPSPRLTLTPLFSTAPMDTACTPVFTTPMPMVPTTDPMLDTTIL